MPVQGMGEAQVSNQDVTRFLKTPRASPALRVKNELSSDRTTRCFEERFYGSS